jgi:predicted Zn-dependent protease
MYSRGWAMIHMLMLKKDRQGQLTTYLQLIARGADPVSAGKQAFGDLGRLDGDLNGYVRQPHFQSLRIAAEKMPVGAITVRQLRPCEAQIINVRMRSAAGVTEKSAPDVAADAERAVVGCEKDAFVQRTLTEAEYDAKHDDAAMAAADRTLALEPTNIMAMVYKGRVYARRKDWANARSWLIKANRQDPNYALPLVLYYDSFVHAGEKPTAAATAGLYRAIVLAPQDNAVRLRVARSLIAEGDLKRARTLLAPVAALSEHGKNKAAGDILKLIDQGKDSATVLAEADKAKWNKIGDDSGYKPKAN